MPVHAWAERLATDIDVTSELDDVGRPTLDADDFAIEPVAGISPEPLGPTDIRRPLSRAWIALPMPGIAIGIVVVGHKPVEPLRKTLRFLVNKKGQDPTKSLAQNRHRDRKTPAQNPFDENHSASLNDCAILNLSDIEPVPIRLTTAILHIEEVQ